MCAFASSADLERQPVPLLWQLRTSRRQKTLLTIIFAMASLYVMLRFSIVGSDCLPSVCFVSIVRLCLWSQGDSVDVTCESAVVDR